MPILHNTPKKLSKHMKHAVTPMRPQIRGREPLGAYCVNMIKNVFLRFL